MQGCLVTGQKQNYGLVIRIYFVAYNIYILTKEGINMYCTKCGALIEESSRVCRSCGEAYGDIVSKKQSELEKFKVTDDESSKK